MIKNHSKKYATSIERHGEARVENALIMLKSMRLDGVPVLFDITDELVLTLLAAIWLS